MTIFGAGRGGVTRRKTAAGGGGTPGARPAFSQAGTAYENTTLTMTHLPLYPATVTAGEMAFAVLWGTSTSVSTNFSLHADATSAGWTNVTGSPLRLAAGTEALLVAYRTGLAGTEDGAAMEGGIVGVGNETTSHVHGIIFTVSAANGFAATPLEGITSAAAETGTTVSGPTVTPGSTNRLAVSIIGFSDDGITAAAFSGASATWTERIDVETGLQTDSTVQVQTAPADAEVSGGNFTAALDTTRLRFAFAIAPATV